jgi:tetratricopeptide (TPR) repeat protein
MSDPRRSASRVQPPALTCPACGEPARSREQEACWNCGLRQTCRICGERYADPLNQRFCTSCGAAMEPGATVEEPEVAEPAPPPPVRRPGVGELFSKLPDTPAVASSMSKRLRDQSVRAVRRRVRSTLWSEIAQLYLELSEALMEEGRFREAITAYRQALKESDDGKSLSVEVWASLADKAMGMAETLTQAGDDVAARDEALRAALQAALRAPDELGRTARRAGSVLDERALSSLGTWIAREWWEQAEPIQVRQGATASVALLAGRAALYVGEHHAAVERLRTARKAAGITFALRGPPLGRDPLPRALLEAEPARAHLVLARAYEALWDSVRALKEVEIALDVGFAPSEELEVQALELKARVLDVLGRKADASAALVDVARALGQRGRYDAAVAPLERAAKLAPAAPQPRWHLADVLRLAARLDKPPFIDEQRLSRARQVADEGFGFVEVVNRGDAWAFCVDALIDNDLSALSHEPATHRAAALVAAERALALDQDSADAWAVAGECARKLGLYATAAGAISRAIELDGENVLACQGEISLYASVQSPQARELISRHGHALAGYEAALTALEGELRLRERDYAAARRRLNRARKHDPDRPFIRLNRGFAALLAGDEDAAAVDFERAREVTAGVTPDRKERAWARWVLGDNDDAESDFEILRRDTGTSALEGIAGLGCCAAARGDLDGAARLWDEALALIPHRGDAARLGMLFSVAALRLEGEAQQSARAACERAEAIEASAPSDPEPETAEAELRLRAEAGEPGTPAWLSAQLALARLAVADEQWERAAGLYEALTTLPEAPRLRARCLREWSRVAQRQGDVPAVEALQASLRDLGESAGWADAVAVAAALAAAGDGEEATRRLRELMLAPEPVAPSDAGQAVQAGDLLLELGDIGGAELAYEAGLGVAARGSHHRAGLQARLGVSAALQEDLAESRQWLLEAVRSFNDAIGEAFVGFVLEICETVTPHTARRSLDTAVRALLEDPALTGSCRRQLVATRSQLLRTRYVRRRLPLVVPVSVGVARRLLPDGRRSPLAEQLVREVFPEVRANVKARTGVRIPGIMVKIEDTLEDDYVVLVREVRIGSGQLPSERVCCPDVAACGRLGIEGAPAEDGLWLDDQSASAAESHGLVLLDHATILGQRLEALLRPRLASFVGVSEIDRELDKFAADQGPAGSDALTRAVPDRGARVGFVRLLERLVAEQVPIPDLDVLLEVFAEHGGDPLDLIAVVEAARVAVAARVAARGFERVVLPLDDALVERVRAFVTGSDSARLLAVPEPEAQALLAEIGALLEDRPAATTALGCRPAEMRPFVQRLVDSRAPGVPVLSHRELELLQATGAEDLAESAR